MPTRLDKSRRQRPTFPFPDKRLTPDASISAPAAPPRSPAPATPAALDLAQTVRGHLLNVRRGVTVGRVFGSVVVLEKITTDHGTTFYHLTDEARGVLRDGLALPWGI